MTKKLHTAFHTDCVNNAEAVNSSWLRIYLSKLHSDRLFTNYKCQLTITQLTNISLFSFFTLLVVFISGCGTSDRIRSGWNATTSIFRRGEKKNEQGYFVVEVNNVRRSRGQRTIKQEVRGGKTYIVTSTEQSTRIVRDGTSFEQTHTRRVVTTATGAAVSVEERQKRQRETRETRVDIDGTRAVFRWRVAGKEETESLQVPDNVMFGIEPLYLLSFAEDSNTPLQVGQNYEATVLDWIERRLLRERVTVLRRDEEMFLGSVSTIWTVEIYREGTSPMTMRFTSSGDLVLLQAEDLAIRAVTQAEWEDEKELAQTITTNLPLNFTLPAWDYFDQLDFRLEPGDVWRPFINNCEYQQITPRDSNSILLTLQKTVPKRQSTQMQLPYNNLSPELTPYIAVAENILPRHPQIIAAAQNAIQDSSAPGGYEKNALQAVIFIAGWVNERIKFDASGSLGQSPLATLQTGRGDCVAHADLFASMARSLGIPTRHCRGFLMQKSSLQYHTWIEAWVNGWVSVDTTVNRVGLPAGYMLMARCEGDGRPRDEFPAIMRRHSDINVTLLTAIKRVGRIRGGAVDTSGEYALEPERKSTYVHDDFPMLLNLYWGFQVSQPPDWEGSGSLDRAEMISPEGDSMIRIEALGTVPARPIAPGGELQSLEALKRSQQNTGLRIIHQDISEFARTRAIAEVIDFIFQQDGVPIRGRQYFVPRRDRSYRITLWAPEENWRNVEPVFKSVLNTIMFR